jgi:hypothetical protein
VAELFELAAAAGDVAARFAGINGGLNVGVKLGDLGGQFRAGLGDGDGVSQGLLLVGGESQAVDCNNLAKRRPTRTMPRGTAGLLDRLSDEETTRRQPF